MWANDPLVIALGIVVVVGVVGLLLVTSGMNGNDQCQLLTSKK